MLKRITACTVICDGCGERINDPSSDNCDVFLNQREALDAMYNQAWTRDYEFEPLSRARTYCPKCAKEKA